MISKKAGTADIIVMYRKQIIWWSDAAQWEGGWDYMVRTGFKRQEEWEKQAYIPKKCPYCGGKLKKFSQLQFGEKYCFICKKCKKKFLFHLPVW